MENAYVSSLEQEISLHSNFQKGAKQAELRSTSLKKSNTYSTYNGKSSGFKNFVTMKMITWSRESHGLFDYENINTSK